MSADYKPFIIPYDSPSTPRVTSFAANLAMSQRAVDYAAECSRAKGYKVLPILRDTRRADEGDLLVFRLHRDGVSHIYRVDVKVARQWTAVEFPFDNVDLTANYRPHLGWHYLVFSADLRQALWCQVNEPELRDAKSHETGNPAGPRQISWGVPLHYFTHIQFEDPHEQDR